MRSLNTYLFEKLKINKNTLIDDKFHPGDEICFLTLYFNNEWDKKVLLEIRQPFTLKSIDDKKIVYNVPFHDRDVEMENCYINSHGYYQHDNLDDRSKSGKRNYANEIILKPHKYKEILELIIKEKAFNPKYSENAINKIEDLLDKDYFDGIDMKELKSKTLIFYNNSYSGIVMPFERPKELKELIDKYYAEY